MPLTSPETEPRDAVAAVRRLDDRTVAWLARTDHGVLLRGGVAAGIAATPLGRDADPTPEGD